jgi:hypothetical protein
MIAKGTTHNNGARLAAYMETSKEGEHAVLWQLRGFGATTIRDAFRDVQIMAGATKAQQPFFHVQVRNREGETLTRAQWELAADRIERMLGLTGQPRAIAFHTYEHNGDEHMHVAWSRIDQDRLTARPLPFFKGRLKKISRELELHFALEPVTNQREGRIKYAPTKAQEEQARRLGLDIHEVRNTIRNCWDRSDCGASFQAALEHEGLTLAQGERRDFVVIDSAGGTHALGKRILDMTATEIRKRLSDLSRDELPTVEMVRVFLHEAEQEKQKPREKPEPVWDRDRADLAWQDAVINAAIEKEKVAREFVEPKEKQERVGVGGRERERVVVSPPPEPMRSSSAHQFEDAARETLRAAKDASEKRAGVRAERGSARPLEKAVAATTRIAVNDGIRQTAKVGKTALRGLGKMLDAFSNAFDSLVAPKLTPEQLREAERAKDRREAEAENTIDFSRVTAEAAQQTREAARERERYGGGRER